MEPDQHPGRGEGKKLVDIATHWASRKGPKRDDDDDEYLAQLEHWGLAPEEEPEDPDEECQVMPECRDAFEVFIRCSTQWRYSIPPMGGKRIIDGLHYPGVEVVIRALGLRGKRAQTAMLDVQRMEWAAIKELNA